MRHLYNRLLLHQLLLFLAAAFPFLLNAQQDTIADSIRMPEFAVRAYFSRQPLLRVPESVTTIDSSRIAALHQQSILPALNTVPGVRMEERSPGSYRLSVRGSLLRSPFGVRNVKVYAEEFPLTDGTGNTYLNLLDPFVIRQAEILKGPDGSLFGANSGGVVRLGLFGERPTQSRLTGEAQGGSYGFLHGHLTLEQPLGAHIFTLTEGWQRSDGYRDNSAMDRQFFQMTDRFGYRNAGVKALFFFSNLKYRTPGALTWNEMQEDPRQSRPATATLPGAREQQAGVYDKTLFIGIQQETRFGPHFRHLFAVSGSHTDFQNPFITNTEVREENTGSLRTWLEASGNDTADITVKSYLGVESISTRSHISNYDNDFGTPGVLQNRDNLVSSRSFLFVRGELFFYKRVTLEAAASLNFNRYSWERLAPEVRPTVRQRLSPVLMPKLAVSWLVTHLFSLRASVARGYSPPTLAELRAPDDVVNTALQPESGWNYEAGFRLQEAKGRAWLDVSAFYFALDHAIVRRVNAAGEDYFINAGGTRQPGIEALLLLHFLRDKTSGWIRDLQASAAYAWSPFTFGSYIVGEEDFSGNRLTGVPRTAITATVEVKFPRGFFIYFQHNYVSSIPLNDANTAVDNSYHLLQGKFGWERDRPRYLLQLYIGADNLLNDAYSLGNDLNAANARYFNPAPPRNYFAGVAVQLR